MTTKTYSVAGTSTLNGTTKIRFANDFVSRFKILAKNGHDNIELIELGGEFTKAEVCQILMNHPKMQDEDRQGAIYEYVVRNCREIKQEIEEKMLALEEQHTSGGRCVDPAQIERAVGLQSILIQDFGDCPQLSRIEQETSNLQAGGSNPSGQAKVFLKKG